MLSKLWNYIKQYLYNPMEDCLSVVKVTCSDDDGPEPECECKCNLRGNSFGFALNWLNAGSVVSRKSSPQAIYFIKNINTPSAEIWCINFADHVDGGVVFSSPMVLAMDWEVVANSLDEYFEAAAETSKN